MTRSERYFHRISLQEKIDAIEAIYTTGITEDGVAIDTAFSVADIVKGYYYDYEPQNSQRGVADRINEDLEQAGESMHIDQNDIIKIFQRYDIPTRSREEGIRISFKKMPPEKRAEIVFNYQDSIVNRRYQQEVMVAEKKGYVQELAERDPLAASILQKRYLFNPDSAQPSRREIMENSGLLPLQPGEKLYISKIVILEQTGLLFIRRRSQSKPPIESKRQRLPRSLSTQFIVGYENLLKVYSPFETDIILADRYNVPITTIRNSWKYAHGKYRKNLSEQETPS